MTYTPPLPLSVYAQRRARLAAQLGAGGIAIVPTAPERARNRDNVHNYRHDSYFFYLTGKVRYKCCNEEWWRLKWESREIEILERANERKLTRPFFSDRAVRDYNSVC